MKLDIHSPSGVETVVALWFTFHLGANNSRTLINFFAVTFVNDERAL